MDTVYQILFGLIVGGGILVIGFAATVTITVVLQEYFRDKDE